MEHKEKTLTGIFAAVGLLVLILDSRLALEGAESGIELCIKTVVPSLFPFFVLSMMLTGSLAGWTPLPLQKLAKILGIPRNCISVLIPAFLGGYPVGAKCVGDLYRRNHLGRQDAECLLAFCSNAGPSFLFGMVSAFFPEKKAVWLLWFIHILSAVLTAWVLPIKSDHTPAQSQEASENASVVLSAAKAMALVCCWVILFRTLIAFLKKWVLWILPSWVQVLVMGTLELTNGCCELMTIADESLRFVVCACMLSLGGICVLLQTMSVIQGLSVRWYVIGKLVQTAFSFLLSCSIVTKSRLAVSIWIPVLWIFLRKIQKRSRNPRPLPV